MNNSDEQMKEEDHSTSSIPHVTSAPVLCEVPSTNDSSISECSSLGRKSIFRVISHHEEISFLGASPVSAEKKKRNRCTWPTCNKKLGLTGKISRNSFSSKNLSFPQVLIAVVVDNSALYIAMLMNINVHLITKNMVRMKYVKTCLLFKLNVFEKSK